MEGTPTSSLPAFPLPANMEGTPTTSLPAFPLPADLKTLFDALLALVNRKNQAKAEALVKEFREKYQDNLHGTALSQSMNGEEHEDSDDAEFDADRINKKRELRAKKLQKILSRLRNARIPGNIPIGDTYDGNIHEFTTIDEGKYIMSKLHEQLTIFARKSLFVADSMGEVLQRCKTLCSGDATFKDFCLSIQYSVSHCNNLIRLHQIYRRRPGLKQCNVTVDFMIKQIRFIKKNASSFDEFRVLQC